MQAAKLASLALLATSSVAHPEPTVRNANHIFNSIHSSMREWGSTLFHNGLTFYLATVPAGTQLYHGTHSPEPTTGMEWLSFEMEQAILFARLPSFSGETPKRPPGQGTQKPMSLGPKETSQDSGFLHTYTPARDLRLLYIDGLSAAMTNNGTHDAQNRIFLNDTMRGADIVDEGASASEMCRLLRETYDDRLDGILRMEIGSEIILCSFERDLEFVRATRAKPMQKVGFPGHRSKEEVLADLQPDVGSWLSVAARYRGIGGNRVRVDYDHLVTAYAYDLDLFGGKSLKNRPRLEHLDSSLLEPVRRELRDVIMTQDPITSVSSSSSSRHPFNWQAITDMIVERYAHTLRYLVSGVPNQTEIRENIDRLLEPFIAYNTERNITREADHCKTQFLPLTPISMQSTAAQAIQSVTQEICWTLLEAQEAAAADHPTVIDKIAGLVKYLSWSTWKECNGCKDNEMCMVPVAPVSAAEDYDHPRCRDVRNLDGSGKKYWGGFYVPSPN